MRRRLLVIAAALVAMTTAIAGCASSSQKDSAPSHNQADVTFAQHMIPHHQQAIQMSDVVLGKQGVDSRVVTLATQIKAAQGPEIQEMQTWLSQWGAPTAMADHGAMTGMMSEQDMAALNQAQGAQASKLFLTQMIAHHQGAIAMAQDEIKSGQNTSAVALAHSIADSQQRQIADMQAMLASL